MSTRGRPRVLIFDLDGTLIDSMGPAADLFCDMLRAECGIPDAISLPVYTQLMGKGPKAQFDAVLRSVETWEESLVQDLTNRYWAASEEHVPDLFPDVLPALEQLRRDGHRLIVSSGSIPSSVARKIRVSGIDRLFELALGSNEDAPERAKGPGHFAMISEALTLHRDELATTSVFIGDGIYDMQVAREAGMLAVGRLTGDNAGVLLAAGADHVITNLGALRRLLHTP